MAYSRYIPEIKDKDGNIYGVMDKEARAGLDRKYEKPSAGIPASDIASGVIPDVPAWAKAAQKPSYTAAEVGATTEQEVNSMIASAIGDIHSFDLEIVQALPTMDIKTHTIYLLPKTGETNDAYDEYAYINNSWEMIGNTQIDLSGYALKSELPKKVSDLNNDAGYLTQHQDISGKANSADLAAVATSGDYADLSNKPTIPTVPVQDVQVNGVSAIQNGILQFGSGNGFSMASNGNMFVQCASNGQIKDGTNHYRPITPHIQDASTFYGLAKAAGADMAQSSNAVGTYTDEAKSAIQTMLNVPSKTDTILDTTLSRGRKESTTVGASSFAFGDNVQASGLVSHAEGRGTTASGELAHAEGNYAKAYGFASHAEGNYTEASGNSSHVEGYGTIASGELSHAEGSQTAAIGPHSHAEGHNNYSLSTNSYEINDQQYNLKYGAAGTADHSEGYDTIADSTLGGTLNDSYAAHAEGVGTIAVANAQHAQGKWNAPDTNFADVVGNGTENARSNAYALTWSGDGKFAGNVYVGCGTDSSGGTMLPNDVQVNGASIVDQNGVANIPLAITGISPGVVKPQSDYGTRMIGTNNDMLATNLATDAQIKAGTNQYKPIVPSNQDKSVFYGLAKAAGDTTQSQSSNAVGTYTDEAKAAIQAMLGIQDGSTGTVDISGTDPVITAVENTRYVCGEVISLNFTPPASGISIVRFTSGSTVTVLTIPSTVKFPEWFDPTSLETNTIYEICVTDGEFGAVMSWAL